MTINDITKEGWYWWRLDGYRYWEIVYVEYQHNAFQVKAPLMHSAYHRGEYLGPIDPPFGGVVGKAGWGCIACLGDE
jgi:hypothetical protein